MKFRYVWFDLGLTLVRSPFEELYNQVLAAFDVQKEEDEIKRAFYLTDKEFMRNYPHVLGTLPAHFMPWYLGLLNYKLGLRLNIEETYRIYTKLKEGLSLKWRLIPGVAEMLKELRQRGVHIGLITNWDASCRSVLNANNLDGWLDITVISSEVGIEKPEKAIFQMALDEAGAEAEEVLYVGDNYYDDVVGAGQAGIRSLLIAPYGRLGIEEINHEYIISNIKEVADYLE